LTDQVKHLDLLFEDWFLDYASYVITDRAIPNIFDGLKPVQRRILHAMKDLDDGRYNKVANLVGNTMKYHPHGDASIYHAMVNLGQKNLLIDTQGNWGDPVTGDPAAAARYIEARLNPFALEVVFNPQLTPWQLSYDGRNKEPVSLPVKFPLLLSSGIEGIAVGMSTKILPHNFNELIESSINYLKGKDFDLFPDFSGGGIADVSNYNLGVRGSRVRVRAKIDIIKKNLLEITEIPYGTTTSSLIDSIVAANDKGKIKISKIDDNTARKVSIEVFLSKGSDPEKVIQQLYAFTDCEASISPLACVIHDNKPIFTDVKDILRRSTDQTRNLLQKELEIKKKQLLEKWHHKTLEKIFIEKNIYESIKRCTTNEDIYSTIERKLVPFKKSLKRPIIRDDVIKLTEIRIKRISKYDSNKARDELSNIEEEISSVEKSLSDMTKYSIQFFKNIKKKYGKSFPRKTTLETFDNVQVDQIVRTNLKLFFDKQGYIGTGLKEGEFGGVCSPIDDILFIRSDGTYKIIKATEKYYAGGKILYAGRFVKNDTSIVFNILYQDIDSLSYYLKRFTIKSLIREKEYRLFSLGRIIFFSTDPNPKVKIKLAPSKGLRKKVFDVNFKDFSVKGQSAQGNLITKKSILKIERIINKDSKNSQPSEDTTSETKFVQESLFSKGR